MLDDSFYGRYIAGLITQLLTTAEWGELDYLVVDFPPGTGDIQLTLCQTVAFSAAVIVTTPQKLAFIDVAKGIRMFARLMVRTSGLATRSYEALFPTLLFPFVLKFSCNSVHHCTKAPGTSLFQVPWTDQ